MLAENEYGGRIHSQPGVKPNFNGQTTCHRVPIFYGRTHFRVAGEHRLAQRHGLADIFGTLSERFGTTRRALNDISDRLFALSSVDDRALEKLLNTPGKAAGGD